jgi:ubiquinone/menaquinone biosynthesis C-methylase UbiE
MDKDKQIHRVLDVGTGTGIWAIDFGGAKSVRHTEKHMLMVMQATSSLSQKYTIILPNLHWQV